MSSGQAGILIIADIKAEPGGMYHHMLEDKKCLEDLGFKCSVQWAMPVARYLPPWLHKALSPTLVFIRVLLKLMRGQRIRVLQVHEPSALTCAWFARVFGWFPRVVVRSHGVEEKMHKDLADELNYGWAHRVLSGYFHWRNTRAFRLASHILVMNQTDKIFLENKGIEPHKILVSPCGISEQLVELRAGASSTDSKVIVNYLGPWKKSKGCDVMETIMNRILNSRTDVSFQLLGAGSNVWRESPGLSRYSDRVRVIPGYERPEDLKRFMNPGQITVNTSRWDSGPLTVLEAMALQNAVIVSDRCFLIQDIAGDSDAVVRVPARDVTSYVEWILRLADVPSLRHSCGVKARKIACRMAGTGRITPYAELLRNFFRDDGARSS